MHGGGVRVVVMACGLAAMAATLTRTDAQAPSAVRGRVEIGDPPPTRRPSAAYATRAVPGRTLAPPSEVRNVVVYLKGAPAQAMPPATVEIVQRNETFVPHLVAVPVGSTVAFPNADAIYHNVFSLSRPKTFNLGRYPQGQSKQVRVDRPGVVRVFCDIHSHMSATVYVFNHPWFTQVGEDGRFTLPGVSPGRHELAAWHERLGETTVQVTVEAGRDSVTDFTLPVPPQ